LAKQKVIAEVVAFDTLVVTLTPKLIERLRERGTREGISLPNLVRRAVEAYLS
jgi:hypothetical protein